MTTSNTNTDHRSSADRRDHRSRRKHADARSVYLELCRSVLRVAVVTDEQQESTPKIRTRTVPWRYQATDLSSEEGCQELKAALREIVSTEKLAGCRASIAINSTLCVNRTSSGASTKVEQEVEAFQNRSQLYLALGAGEKITAVARKQIDARHLHALVTVANEQTLRQIVDSAEAAGLVVGLVESSLVSLGRLQGILDMDDEAPVFAQTDDDRYEVGVCRQGQLMLEYRPAGDAKLEDLGSVIDDHRDRMQRYCRRQYGIGDLELGRLFIVGDAPSIARITNSAEISADFESYQTAAIKKYWQLESETPGGEMAATLGLALRDTLDDIGASPNLMEHILALSEASIRPFLIKALVPLAATLLIAAGLWAFNVEQGMEISALNQKLSKVNPQALESQRLTHELMLNEREVVHLRQLEERTPYEPIAPMIPKISQCLPEDVWLKRFLVDGELDATIAGTSYSEGGVYEFMRHLDQSPWFTEVALGGTESDQTGQGPATSFDMKMRMASPTLGETNDE